MISLCLISNDEPQKVLALIESFAELATEFIVVDTRINPTENYRNFPDSVRVFSYDWNNDFSAARNFALDKVTQKWVMMVDCDNRMKSENQKELKTFLEKSTDSVVMLPCHFHGEKKILPKIWFRSLGVRYQYPVHEDLIVHKEAITVSHNAELFEIGDHTREMFEKSRTSYVQIMKQYLERNPHDLRMLYFMVADLFYLQRYEEVLQWGTRFLESVTEKTVQVESIQRYLSAAREIVDRELQFKNYKKPSAMNIVVAVIKSFFGFSDALLVVLQNNNEVRAAGGFITQVVEVSHFKIRPQDVFSDLKTSSKHTAPDYIQKYLYKNTGVSWQLRDANNEPDFSRSAEQIMSLYEDVESSKKLQSIIAVNFSFIESLLSLYKKVVVAGEVVTSKNLFTFLSVKSFNIDRHNLNSIRSRKNILMKVAKKLIVKMIFQFWLWPSLFGHVNKSVKNRDLQIYNKDDTASLFVARSNEDFLAVIEDNYLGGKSNRYVERSIMHHTTIERDMLRVSLQILWQHLGVFDPPLSTKYIAYIRLFLPLHAKLVTQKDFQHTEKNEKGFKVVSFMISVNPLDRAALHLEYLLPPITKNYSFRYFKQAGIKNESLHKTLSVSPYYVLNECIGFSSQTERSAVLNVSSVDADISVEAEFIKNPSPPSIIGHDIIGENLIRVIFNEDVALANDFVSLSKIYSVDSRNEVIIAAARAERNVIFLETNNLPSEKEKFYSLELEGIYSVVTGNEMHPRRRIVTVVVR